MVNTLTQALELTEERKADLELLQMRGVLDPKRFYKRSDKEGLPKYFQVPSIAFAMFCLAQIIIKIQRYLNSFIQTST